MKKGFTLSELLIALAILGVIATFTIPKVLQSQQDTKFKSIAKEAAATLSASYQAYKLQNTPTATFTSTLLKPYLNYVKEDTVTKLDGAPYNGAGSSFFCSSGYPCVRLHNGSMLYLYANSQFSNTTPLNLCAIMLDPDGTFTGKNDSLWFHLHWDGRITTVGNTIPGSTSSEYTYPAANPANDPSWFSWN